MANSSSSTVWERAREGQHSAVLGALPEHLPGDVQVFRVPCEMSRQTLGPILEVSRKAMALLDEKTQAPEGSPGGGWRGLRHRLLEDEPGRSQGMTVVELLNRLQQQLGRPCVAIFEQVEAADMATLLMLREIVTHPGWLQAALVLVFHEPEPQGLAGQLLEAVHRSSGEASVIRLAHPENSAEEGAKAEHDGLQPFAALPASVLRVLRVGAMMGPGFEAALIAQLLECSEVTVLEQLQQAYDLGVPIRDQGTGRFALPQATADKLMATLLPSLARVWHRRLAELLSPEPSAAPGQPSVRHGEENIPEATSKGPRFAEEPESGRVERASTDEVTAGHGFERAADSVPMPEFSGEAVDAQEPRSAVSVEPSSDEEEDPMEAAEAFARDMAEALAEESASWSPPPLEEERPAPTELHGDARAAPHYMAVGEYDAAAQRYLQAAQEAASIGAHSQALHFAREALGLLENLPKSKPRRHLQIQLLTEMGRLQREAIGAHGDLSFSLREALETLEAAQKLLTEDDPVSLRAKVSSEIAQVCYDQGDQEALRRALDELTQASTWLREGGDPTSAVRLLNDQAAVWVRLGDPVRANRLLEHSLGFFQQQDRDNPITRLELAETEHMLARLVLHVPPRPGRESDAVEVGLSHAQSAEEHYKALRSRRRVARVWETMGRLHLRGGHGTQALNLLVSALEVQREQGDLLGLARTTAALSDVLAERGQLQRALALLEQSIALNFEKGSPLGLAYNREALGKLVHAIEHQGHPQLQQAQALLAARLHDAEQVLGKVQLPPRGFAP